MSKHCRLCNDVVRRGSKYCQKHMVDMYPFRDSINRGTLTTKQAEESILNNERIGKEKLQDIFDLKEFLNVNVQGWV